MKGYVWCERCDQKLIEVNNSNSYWDLVAQLEAGLLGCHATAPHCSNHHMTTHIEYEGKPVPFFSRKLRVECMKCVNSLQQQQSRLEQQKLNIESQVKKLTEQFEKNKLNQDLNDLNGAQFHRQQKQLEKQLNNTKNNLAQALKTKPPNYKMECEIPIWGVNAAVLTFHTSHEGHPIKVWYGNDEYIESRGKEGDGWKIASPGYNDT